MVDKNIVLLVDSRERDLMGCALIAHHLERAGIRCHLEPINAWQAVLGAYRPDMVVFNHAFRDHLADYTARLHSMGILTAVLLNEGILYNEDVLAYNSKRHSTRLHLDYFFCWNEIHQQALLAHGSAGLTDVQVVGVPRFDFYFPPWNRVFEKEKIPKTSRPQILVCTNFGFAEWIDKPRAVVDRFFSQWTHVSPLYADYWNAIEINRRSRLRFFLFLRAILKADRYDVVLKIHPRESRKEYQDWIDALPPHLKTHLVFAAPNASITALILGCDLEISCETCTTALESWIARKPTLELLMEKHPLFYHPAHSSLNPACDSPEKIVVAIEKQLAEPDQREHAEVRHAHLAKWCHSPDGVASARVAKRIVEALDKRRASKTIRLNFHDHRRALKLKTFQAIGQPYTFFPLQQMKRRLTGSKKYSKKMLLYDKSIRPREVNRLLLSLDRLDPK
ncbi:MAG: surface carbohydrate biosynthesis protein [Verrucomicrobiota bacterium]